MEKNTSEQGPKQEQVVSLNKEFHPFTEEGIQEDTSILLELGDCKLPVKISLLHTFPELAKVDVITPLDPKEGYQITLDDYIDAKYREDKVSEMNWSDQKVDPSKAYYTLSVKSDLRENPDISPETKKMLERLRIQIKGVDNLYEARPDQSSLEQSYLGLRFFYLQPKGPLAVNVSQKRRVTNRKIRSL